MSNLGSVPPPPPPPGAPTPRPPAIPVAPQAESSGQQSSHFQNSGGQPAPQANAPPASTPAPAPAVTVPAALAGLAPGTTIPAEVVAARADGQVTLQLPGGTAVAQIPNPPPPGTAIALQVVAATAADVRAAVVAVDDAVVDPPVPIRLVVTSLASAPLPPPQATPQPADTTLLRPAPIQGGPAPAPLPAAPSSPGVLPEPGTVLPARLVAPPAQPLPVLAGGGMPSQSLATALAGLPLLARIVQIIPPPNFYAPPGATATPAAPYAPTAGMAVATATQAGAVPLLPGTPVLPATGPVTAAPPATATPLPNTPLPATTTPALSTLAPAVPGTAASIAPPASAGSASTPLNFSAGLVSAAPRPDMAAPLPTPAATASPAFPPAATPGPSQPASQGLIAAVALNGFVMASTQNQAVVATPAGTLVVETRQALPPGAQLALAVEPASLPSASALAAPAEPLGPVPQTPRAALIELAEGWPALRQALSAAEMANPAAVQAFLDQRMPGLGGRAAAHILFFLTALRRGDVGGWLGPELTQALERGRGRERLQRLQAEFAQLSQVADAAGGNDWRVLPFPLFDGNTIDPAFLYYRGKRRGRDGQQKDDLRFLVDVNLSQLGALQLDGLVRGKRFDLAIRSHAPMEEAIRTDITRIFSDGVSATGYTGEVIFQTVTPFPVSPFTEMFGEGRHDRNTLA